MICPRCKAEYVDGIYKCADCQMDLVWELTPEPDSSAGEPIEFVPILTVNSQADMAFVQSVLQGSGIRFWVKNGNLHLVRHGLLGATFMVDKTQLEECAELLREVDINPLSFSTRSK